MGLALMPTGGEPANSLANSVVQILDPQGRPAGTGFLVGDQLLVTCAHVVPGGGGPVPVRFAELDDQPRRAWVLPEHWRDPAAGDVAFLRVADPLPARARPLPLGAAREARRRPVQTYGFPVNAPGSGHYGYGVAGDLIRSDRGHRLLQLLDCTEVTEGFSGGPVLDEQTGLVIGMVDSVAAPDRLGRGRSTAYATPAETLREIHPALSLSAVCPYPGLRAFTTDDAAWFHGRDRAVTALLSGLDRSPGFVALLGPSGSGKSSLVQAGLRPALVRAERPGSDRWGWLAVRPGHDPYPQLVQAGLAGADEAGLAGPVRGWLAGHPEHDRLVLVLDQFEEVLVGAAPPARERLLAELAGLGRQVPAATVVIVLRDDFYSRLAAAAPALMSVLERGLVNVPAVLEPADLRDIINQPARAVGLALEPDLAERIARDTAQVTAPGGTGGQAGSAPTTVLPVLSSALAELWRRRADGRLTHRGYDQLGGVAGWLDRWCDQAYAETCRQLPAEAEPLVRQVVMALVRPGDEEVSVPPTRHRRTLDQLRTVTPGPAGTGGVDPVVDLLASRRLVTTGRDPATEEPVVELAHEALIHEWRTLRRWLAEDHTFLSWRRDVDAAQVQWRGSRAGAGGRDPELLLRGSALAEARRWSALRASELPSALAEYVRLSEAAERRRASRDRRVKAALASLLVLAVLLGSFAWLQFGRAADEAAQAREQARQADSRRASALASALAGQQPDLALLLALEGLRTAPSREAWGSLGTLLSRPVALSQVRYGHTGRVVGAEFDPDGELITMDRQSQLRRWRAGAEQAVAVREPPGTEGEGLPPIGQSLAVSPDGRWLATSNDSDGIWLWDAATGRPVHQFADEPLLNGGVAFSPDGELLAGIVGGGVRLWRTGSWEPAGALIELRTGLLSRLAFRPDGGALATASEQGIVDVRELPSGRTLARFRIEQGAYALEFSPDGELLAVGGESRVVYLVAGEEAVGEPIQVTGRVRDLAFRPDGETLATADSQGVVQQWDVASRDPAGPALLGHAGSAETVAFSPDGGTLATGGEDGTVRLWDFTVQQPLGAALSGHVRRVGAVAFSPDGRTLATGGFDTSVRLWRVDTREQLGPPLVPPGGAVLDPNQTTSPDPVQRVGFTADGRRVLALSNTAVRVWDVTGGGSRVLDLDPDALAAVAFSPDGSRIATAAEDQTVRLWDAAGEPAAGPFRLGFRPGSLALSPEGERLAAAGFPGAVEVRDTGTGEQLAAGQLGEFVPGISAVAFSPDGRTLATADGLVQPDAYLWRGSGSELTSQPLRYDAVVKAVAFTVDGALLVTAADDNTVRLWSVANGEAFADPLVGHTNDVWDVAASPDGELLATAAEDGTARLWATPRTWVRHACEVAGRNLSRAEWQAYFPDTRYVRTCPQYPSGYQADPDAPVADYPAPR